MNYNLYDPDSSIEDIKRYIRNLQNKIHDLYDTIYTMKKNAGKEIKDKSMFSYSIDKKTFVKCMNTLHDLDNYLSSMYDIGIRLNDDHVIFEVQQQFMDLLSNCVDDKLDQKYIYSDLSYFIYDLNWGKDYKPGSIKDEDENDIDFSTVDKVWEYFNTRYFKKKNTKSMTNEEYIKNMSRDELADYIYSVFISGIAKERGSFDVQEMIDYKKWLGEEHKENEDDGEEKE